MQYRKFPVLNINLDAVRNNSKALCTLCGNQGISVAGVVKCFDGDIKIAKAYLDGGCSQLAASRVVHLKRIRKALPDARTLLTRIPMLSEIENVAQYCDFSLHSEEEPLRALNAAAKKYSTHPGVILMLDVGDLREGVPSICELCRLGILVENELPQLRLFGVGANFACLNGVLPCWDNLSYLIEGAREIEKRIGRKLDIISGGSTISLPLLLGNNGMPPGINHLRLGGSIANPITMRLNRGVILPGTREDTAVLTAEIVEVQTKDSAPRCSSLRNWAGNPVIVKDRGKRRRAIAALGSQDIGDASKLVPLDKGVEIVGCSSDHTILDIDDSERKWKVGDKISFRMQYMPLLYAFSGRHVSIRYIHDSDISYPTKEKNHS